MESCDGIESFLTYVVSGLTEYPAAASVRRREENGGYIFDLYVDQADISRIIGKDGGTVNALRGLVQAAATREGYIAGVEVID